GNEVHPAHPVELGALGEGRRVARGEDAFDSARRGGSDRRGLKKTAAVQGQGGSVVALVIQVDPPWMVGHTRSIGKVWRIINKEAPVCQRLSGCPRVHAVRARARARAGGRSAMAMTTAMA